MNDEVRELYAKVQDKLSEEEFLSRMEEIKQKESENPYLNLSYLAEKVTYSLINEEVETISEKPEYSFKTISELEDGSRDTIVAGRVISISNPRSFKTRKGKSGEVCNVELKDNTGTIRAVFWTPIYKLLKNVNEGNIIQIKNVDIKEGFSGLKLI